MKVETPFLELLGKGGPVGECVKGLILEIISGQREIEKAGIGKRTYWTDGCGLRLWLAVDVRASVIRFTSYQISEGLEP